MKFSLHVPMEADGPEKAGGKSQPRPAAGAGVGWSHPSNRLVQHGMSQSVLS